MADYLDCLVATASIPGPRLTSTRTNERQEEIMAGSKIEIRENGPLRVYAPFEMVDKDGNTYTLPEGEFVSICRCGMSQNKPFCDSAHRANEWKGESAAK